MKTHMFIFKNGEVKIGNGKPGYDWHQGYSEKVAGGVTNPIPLADWRAIAKRDGYRLVVCETEAEAKGKGAP